MIAYKETQPEISDISAIINLALTYPCKMPWMDLSTPRMWIAQGCDMMLDVLPVMEEIMKKKSTITTYSYFTNAVLAARDKRIVLKKKPAEQEKTQEEKDAARAQNIQWHKDRGIVSTRIGPQDYAWLDAYENKKAPSEERA